MDHSETPGLPRTELLRRMEATSSAERRSLAIEVVSGPDIGREITVAGPVIVGRGETSDLRLTDPTVSQFHIELSWTAPGITVRDLGSLNSTCYRGAYVRDLLVPIGSDLELELGTTRLRVTATAPYEAEQSKSTSFGELVGIAAPMRELFAILERLARGDLSVLIEGAPGTGKETVARALAGAGPRRARAFEVIDCAAVPHHLADGAFTDPSGALAASTGATLFLEDVSELPLAIQSTLARALKDREPGATRLLSSSRLDLRTLVNRGAFREDLYDAIAQARVRVPSLSERADDLKPLVLHFLAKVPWETTAARSIDPVTLEAIVAQSFPANVRELRTFVERAAKIAEGATITMADLDFAKLLTASQAKPASREAAQTESEARAESADEPLDGFKEAKRTVVDEFERTYLSKLLARSGKNISRAAALAGIERQSLRDLLRRHGLSSEG